jgi:integrase
MPIHTLSPREVANKAKPGLYGDGGNLFLRVASGGAKSWVFRYWYAGKRRVISLGSCDTVSLADARTKAHEQRRLRLDGHDPAAAREVSKAAARVAEASTITFAECAQAYITAHRAGWRTVKQAKNWTATLQAYAHPVIGDLPVAAIDLPLILRVLEPLWTEKTSTAARIRTRLESILDWATVRGYRTGENPARWKGNLEHLLAKKSKIVHIEHYPALPYTDIGAFMTELRARPGLPAKAAEFVILTAVRAGEVTGATWSEIDLKSRVWVIPSELNSGTSAMRRPITASIRRVGSATTRNADTRYSLGA